MSEDFSVTSLLDDYADTSASFVRTSAAISTEQSKLSAAFSSSSNSDSDSSNSSVQTMSDNQILNELKMHGLSSLKTARQIASDYNISIARAQQILDELQQTDNHASYSVESDLTNSYSYSVDYNTGEDSSTVAYSV